MTNNNLQGGSSSITNTAKTINKNKFIFYNGKVYNNTEPPIEPPVIACTDNNLDFSCAENSQYIPAV